MKTVLVSALSILVVGSTALVNVQEVMADTPNIAKSDYDPSKVKNLKVQMNLSQDTSSGKLKITSSIDTFPEGMNEISIPFFLFNVKTQVTEKFPGLADAIFTPSQPGEFECLYGWRISNCFERLETASVWILSLLWSH